MMPLICAHGFLFDPTGLSRCPECTVDDEWYDSLGLALQILGKHWYEDLTAEEDEFALAFADTVSPRPTCEMPCAPCTSAAGLEIVHSPNACPRRQQ